MARALHVIRVHLARLISASVRMNQAAARVAILSGWSYMSCQFSAQAG
jgi:hypothetical protein